MARVLVFTDRTPSDPDWKGAFAWGLIRALAESQHQILVLTTAEPESIGISHPRLTIGRPAHSWSARHLAKFIQGLILFRPDVIYTFALKPSKIPAALTIWSYLHGACLAFPKLKRFSGYFETSDIHEKDASLAWHRGSHGGMVFTPDQQRALSEKFQLRTEVLPVELEYAQERERQLEESTLLVPAPVSAWRNPEGDLKRVAEFLLAAPNVQLKIVGGWGEIPLSQRRNGWQHLLPIADRVSMLENLQFEDFVRQVRETDSIWLDSLPADSWRHVVSTFVAEGMGRTVHGHRPHLVQGSTANFLSRLFAQT